MSKVTFRFFVESYRGNYGEYANDDVEKYMVVSLINKLLGGARSEANYNLAYSFIESDTFKPHYDDYYDAFEERFNRMIDAKRNKVKPTEPLSKKSQATFTEFNSNIHALFAEWKNSTR
jgi:hypothetical protein